MVGTRGPARYRDSVVSIAGPIKLASRRMVTDTSGRRRARPRAYPSISRLSLAKPPRKGRRLVLSSVNMTGSCELEPYTSDVDFNTTRRTDGAFWQAANSCIAPITLISFSAAEPPDRGA